MLSSRVEAALIDIRHNILTAQRFVSGLSLSEFKQSDLHFYAVTRALEIVSEASRRLPEELRLKHSSLPWKQIMGVGNIYRHDYDDVSVSYVWATVHDHLQPLLDVVSSELDEGPPQ